MPNCIAAEANQRYNVGLIFSIDEFVQDGEVQWLAAHLTAQGYILRPLVGALATVVDWMSDELKAKRLPEFVFDDMTRRNV